MQEVSIAPLFSRPSRAHSRHNAERAHAHRNNVAIVATKRADGLKHKTRGTAPREVFIPLEAKAKKLTRRAGLHRADKAQQERTV